MTIPLHKNLASAFRISLLFLMFFLIQFFSSCCGHVKFYDFSEMSFEMSSNRIEMDEDLHIEFFAEDVEFVASWISDLAFTSALALGCDDGWGGMKFPFKSISISSNSDFNAELVKEQNLVELFEIRVFSESGEFESVPLSQVDTETIPGLNFELILKTRPQISKTHCFKLELAKSNGSLLIIDLDQVEWI